MVKDRYFQRRWSSERYAAGMGLLEEVVSFYQMAGFCILTVI